MSQKGNMTTYRFQGLSASQQGNLAVQTSVMELLDEFTEIISGELRPLESIERDIDNINDN